MVPPKSNRKVQRDHDENYYEDRNKIERCLAASSRHVTSLRYEKTAYSFLAFIHLAATPPPIGCGNYLHALIVHAIIATVAGCVIGARGVIGPGIIWGRVHHG